MTLGSRNNAVEGDLERRILAAMLIVICIWMLLIARLFYLQVIEGDRFQVSAERNSVRTHRVHASRGMILDRTGAILVDSRPGNNVRIVPDQAGDMAPTLERLALLLGEEPEDVRARFGKPRGRDRFQALMVARDVSRDARARVDVRRWALPGVITEAEAIRHYRFGESAAHLLGMLGEISRQDLKQRTYQGYRSGDVIGKKGIERTLDRELRGRDGGRNVKVDAYGRELAQLTAIEPEPGANVVLTIDARLQRIAEAKLDELEKAGAVVALDPRNGEVLVMASRPSFDPNRFARGIESQEWRALLEDKQTPLHDRTVLGQFPPGSTYKVIPALGLLESDKLDPGMTVTCRGAWFGPGRRPFRCWKKGGHGVVDYYKAIVQSCDVFFYQVGDRLGVDGLAYYARALGLGSPTGIPRHPENAGLVPTEAWKRRRFGEKWYPGETISVAIGQGYNQWTPMQMAVAYAAIGNGGTRWRPFVIKRIEDPYGDVIEETRPEIVAEVPISKASLEKVRLALRGVVHEPRGTGGRMRGLADGVEAAGKTGTAQVIAMGKERIDSDDLPDEYRDHAWFATFVPAENPTIAIAVLVEHGGHGGSAAAPIARAVVDAYLENQKTDALPKLGPQPGQVAERPSVRPPVSEGEEALVARN